MINLFECPLTGAQRVKSALEALGVDDTAHVVDLRARADLKDDYQLVQALSAGPAIETNRDQKPKRLRQ